MRDILIFGAGVLVGFLLAGGGWMLTLAVILGLATVVAILVWRAIQPPTGGRRR